MLEGLNSFVELDVLFHEGLDLELAGLEGFGELCCFGEGLLMIFVSWLIVRSVQLILCLDYPFN